MAATPPAVPAVELRDSARRSWRVEARRDGRRGRFLVLRPVHGDNEPFRAAADGWRPDAYLPIPAEDWELLARLAASGGGGPGTEALRDEAFRRVDRMVVEAQHRALLGAADDEDEDEVEEDDA
jgi:hypothetical protein